MAQHPNQKVALYPEPIRLAYNSIFDDPKPYVQIRRLLDAFECLLKFFVIVDLQDLCCRDNGRKAMAGFLSGKFVVPTLGIWVDLMHRIADARNETGDGFIPELKTFFGDGRTTGARLHCNKLPLRDLRDSDFDFTNVKSALGEFVNIRNWYAHSAVPPDKVCKSHFEALMPIFDRLIAAADFLNNYRLSKTGNGYQPPVLKRRDGKKCSLYPLLYIENDEYLLFKDARLYRKSKLAYQSYGRMRTVVSDDAFIEFRRAFPLLRADGALLLAHHRQPTAAIFGRDDDIAVVLRNAEPGRYRRILVTGYPGVGKTAFSIYLAENASRLYTCVRIEFNANDRRAMSLPDLYQRILAQLREQCGVRRTFPPDYTVSGVREALGEILTAANRNLPVDRPLMLIVDGLDEAVANGADGCMFALPVMMPPGSRLVCFSRPADAVMRWWRGHEDNTSFIHNLEKLHSEAVRAMLEDAIPWPILHENGAIIGRAMAATDGHPLYLKHLIENILEGNAPEDLSGLPSGMTHYYGRIFDRMFNRPQVAAVAGVVAASAEPLTKRNLRDILDMGATGFDVDLQGAIDTLLEIMEPMALSGRKIGFHFFHYSVTEYLRERHSDDIDRGGRLILAWQVGSKDTTAEWFDGLHTEAKLLPRFREIIPLAWRRLASREVLLRSCGHETVIQPALTTLMRLSATHRLETSYSLMAEELLRRLAARVPDRFVEYVGALIQMFPHEIELYRISLEILFNDHSSMTSSNGLVTIICGRLLNGRRDAVYYHLLGNVACLAGRSNGFVTLLKVLHGLLPFDGVRGHAEVKFLTRLVEKAVPDEDLFRITRRFIRADAKNGILSGGAAVLAERHSAVNSRILNPPKENFSR